jgi:hypothetical protein
MSDERLREALTRLQAEWKGNANALFVSAVLRVVEEHAVLAATPETPTLDAQEVHETCFTLGCRLRDPDWTLAVSPETPTLDAEQRRTLVDRYGEGVVTDFEQAFSHEVPETPTLDGRSVHAAWRDGMLRQGREVAPERMAWETLTQQDRELDDWIAARLSQPENGEPNDE